MVTMTTTMRTAMIRRPKASAPTRTGEARLPSARPSRPTEVQTWGRHSAARGTAASGRGTRTLSFRLPVDELSRLAGMTALIMAILGGAGIISTIAYLAAWEVPAPILRLDPLTAALRSEMVLYQLALTGAVLFGLASLSHRLERRPWVGRVALTLAIAVIAFLGVDAANGGFVGPVFTLSGGVLLFVAHRRAWISDRAIAILVVVVALVSAGQTGFELGLGYREGRLPRTEISLTTTAPVGGLSGVGIDGTAWRYDDLYLVFRDGEAIFVSTPGSGARVWVVPATRISAVELTGKAP